jgi:hypothetical protein
MKPLLTALTMLVFAPLSVAQDVAVPIGQQGSEYNSVERPKTGQSMDQVTSRFGNPDQKLAAVGEPPISRWVYAQYTVYFESNHVIHSVLNNSH